MNVLIADDEKFMREDLQKAVERVRPGNSYFFAENFDSAVKAVEENDIEVAFLDIRMPGKTGLELAKAIRSLRPRNQYYHRHRLRGVRLERSETLCQRIYPQAGDRQRAQGSAG